MGFFFWSFWLALVGWLVTLFFWRKSLREWGATIKLCQTLIEALTALNLIQELNKAAEPQEFLSRYLTSKRKMDD